MRTYIKDFFFLPYIARGSTWKDNYTKSYHGVEWDFTGRIMYQDDENGKTQVSFEVLRNDTNMWVNSFHFGFDDSSPETIVECENYKSNMEVAAS